jgi:hypothetical protein
MNKTLERILSQMSPVHMFTVYFCKTQCNATPPLSHASHKLASVLNRTVLMSIKMIDHLNAHLIAVTLEKDVLKRTVAWIEVKTERSNIHQESLHSQTNSSTESSIFIAMKTSNLAFESKVHKNQSFRSPGEGNLFTCSHFSKRSGI